MRRFPLVVTLTIASLSGCLSDPVDEVPQAAPGIHVYFQDDNDMDRFGPLAERFFDEDPVFDDLMEDKTVHLHLLDMERYGRRAFFLYPETIGHSVSIFVIRDPEMTYGGMQGPSNNIVVNIDAWERGLGRYTPACEGEGLRTTSQHSEEQFTYTIRHELGHVYGLVGDWWHAEREDPDHGGHSGNRQSVMYHTSVFSSVDLIEGKCYTSILNQDFDEDDLADLERAATMRPFEWE